MICTIALNSSIIACSCVCTQKGTTLRMITSDSFNYVNKKRYTISLVIFVCAFVWFHKWICHDSAVLYAEYVSAVWCFEERYSDTNLFYVVVAWIRMSLWNLLLFFSDYSWLDMIFCGIHGEWCSTGASFSLGFSSFSVLITIPLLVHTVFHCPYRCLSGNHQTAHHYVISPYIRGSITALALCPGLTQKLYLTH